jgi:hypothetical protein
VPRQCRFKDLEAGVAVLGVQQWQLQRVIINIYEKKKRKKKRLDFVKVSECYVIS